MSNARLDFQENNYYHVYNRGFNKQIIFKRDRDFQKFYSYVITYHKLFPEIKIISYCFLPNHFHFIFHTLETGLNLSNFMRRVQGAYAMYFKNKYETGLDNLGARTPVFEGRFKAKCIDTDEYLAQCIAYVNFNPLKHEIVSEIEEYPWTSYHQFSENKKIASYRDMMLGELEY